MLGKGYFRFLIEVGVIEHTTSLQYGFLGETQKPMTEQSLEFMVLGHRKKIPFSFLAEQGTFLAICQALSSKESELVIGAALVLGRMSDKRAVPFLLRAFLTTDGRKAQAIAWALGELGDAQAVPFLEEALQASFIPKSAIIALGKIGASAALSSLLKCLEQRDELLRTLAVKSIGHLCFGDEQNLRAQAIEMLSLHEKKESSRSVRLLIRVTCMRLEKNAR